ncbi:outer membrane protein assembly factor BamE [Colwellia echini]|uniref:Outer membrane protein assembly factor BamE n=1 Tax=Colwellia echini TaxID=1982103 RepID=A0ABY3MZN5_9GAMM|nr:outer membrane protein assembly factor BamE [Colwellia echini]TYK66477.1 outer membrane protein assembly factor BamE [Colwellia echini]
MYFRVAIIITAMVLSSCSSWVYRYDIPQGNYLDKKGIDQLQVGMNKEQVKFILGSPVVVDSFNDDTWSYVYKLISGRDKEFDIDKRLILKFTNDKLVSATGDYPLSDKFNIPFNASVPLEVTLENANVDVNISESDAGVTETTEVTETETEVDTSTDSDDTDN